MNSTPARIRALTSWSLVVERPPRFEYVLTPKGEALIPVLIALGAWGTRFELEAPPPVRIVDTRSGDEVEQVFVSRRTGRRVEAEHVRPVTSSETDTRRR